MNIKALFSLSFLLALALSISTAAAGSHHGGGNRVSARSGQGGVARSFSGGSNRMANWSGQRFAVNRNWSANHWTGQNWNRAQWNAQHWNNNHLSSNHWNSNHWSGNNWNWHHHHHDHSVVYLDFGFPFFGWWGYPYYNDYYPYGYSSYGSYPYGYYGNYGSGYYGSYNYDHGNGYGYDNGYSNHHDEKVAELQRRLSSAGYYRGEIDGIWGSRTQYALKAYRHDHPNSNDDSGAYNRHNYPNLRNHPYSPPPTTEPEPTE